MENVKQNALENLKISPLFFPLSEGKNFFSDIYCENVFEILEVILTLLFTPHDWVPLILLILKSYVH